MTTQPTEITQDDKLWALLSYLIFPAFPIIPIIVLLMEDKKNRPFIRSNAIQALGLFVVVLVLSGITVGCLYPFAIIYQIYLAVKAYQGEFVTIPVLTDFMKKQGWLS